MLKNYIFEHGSRFRFNNIMGIKRKQQKVIGNEKP